ncbi:MAG: hypothetical protein IKI88_06245 [Anaerotignum sp.]|nr:hypothetical protein [Anaerotignum sp.]
MEKRKDDKMRMKIIIVGILLFFLGLNLFLSQKDAGNLEIDETKLEDMEFEDADINNSDLPEKLPEMDIELENGIHITAAVLVHNGKSYALTEEEAILIEQGVHPDEVLSKRQKQED